MTFRRTVILTSSCAAALVLSSSLAAAQSRDTTRMRDTTQARDTAQARTAQSQPRVTSDQRLRVQKNGTRGGGAVMIDSRSDSINNAARMRADSMDRVMQSQRDSVARLAADSVAAANKVRTDSIARADSVARVERVRRDSIAAATAAVEAARRDSIRRVDSIANAEQMRLQAERDRYRFKGSGWYLGISAGGAVPTGDFEDLGYQSGYDINVPIGWHKKSNLLGVRLDLGYSAFDGRSFVANTPGGGSSITLTNGSPKVYSAALNATIRFPIANDKFALYGVGGGGLYHFRSYGPTSSLSGFLGNDVLESNESQQQKTRNKFGAQVGGGIDFGVGPASVFLESRFVNVFADYDDNVQFRNYFGENRSNSVRWVPIVLGVNIR